MLTYFFLKYLIINLKYTKILNGVYRDENLIDNLSKMFGVKFRKDWIGRIYAVFNPHVQNGIYDQNKQIYEYNEEGLSDKAYVENYIMNQLNIAKRFISANNLFDLLTYEVRKIDDNDNYLFIMQPITLEDCLKWVKIYSISIISVLIIASFSIYFNII